MELQIPEKTLLCLLEEHFHNLRLLIQRGFGDTTNLKALTHADLPRGEVQITKVTEIPPDTTLEDENFTGGRTGTLGVTVVETTVFPDVTEAPSLLNFGEAVPAITYLQSGDRIAPEVASNVATLALTYQGDTYLPTTLANRPSHKRLLSSDTANIASGSEKACPVHLGDKMSQIVPERPFSYSGYYVPTLIRPETNGGAPATGKLNDILHQPPMDLTGIG